MLNLIKFAGLPFKRCLSSSSTAVIEHLNKRTIIRVSGPDVSNYLQGLITNDVEHLNTGPGSMYTLFLNNAGRILYDAIIYRTLEKNTYLIECDKQASETLQKHLKLYRVRRKIDITNLSDELQVYVLFRNDAVDVNNSSQQITFKAHHDLLLFRDPRIANLGFRVIAKTDTNITTQLNDFVNLQESNVTGRNYRWLRYILGVGEGIEDLPPGECFPLECNGDYLHGVSFHKGCYIGQELTARIHHIGEVRKRLMPIYFSKIPSQLPDKKIVQENVNLGKFRGIENDVGLALLRFAKALLLKEIKLGDGIGVTSKPSWWPAEAPKEKMIALKAE